MTVAIGTRRTPEAVPLLKDGIVVENRAPTSLVLTTAGGARTLTAAEILTGFIVVDTQDAQTMTLPTAALLNAAIPDVRVGHSFDLEIINFGDSTLTVAVGTGITAKVIASVSAVMTLATLVSKRFRLVCTGSIAQGSSSDSWDLYGFGSTAASVA